MGDGPAPLDLQRDFIDARRMPHRDDHEAARQRIAALEQQLAEAEARAERDVEEARARAERAESRADARVERAETRARRAKQKRETSSASSSNPHWPARQRTRFLRAVEVGVFLVDLPIIVFLAADARDLDRDHQFMRYFWVPVVALFVWVFGVGHATRAPFPFSAAATTLLSSAVGLIAVVVASSDVLWKSLLAEPPWRWLARGACGLVAAAIHASLSARFAEDNAPSDPTSGD